MDILHKSAGGVLLSCGVGRSSSYWVTWFLGGASSLVYGIDQVTDPYGAGALGGLACHWRARGWWTVGYYDTANADDAVNVQCCWGVWTVDLVLDFMIQMWTVYVDLNQINTDEYFCLSTWSMETRCMMYIWCTLRCTSCRSIHVYLLVTIFT